MVDRRKAEKSNTKLTSSIHTCIHTYIYIHTHIHTYTHTYIYTHIHTYIYIHTYIHTSHIYTSGVLSTNVEWACLVRLHKTIHHWCHLVLPPLLWRMLCKILSNLKIIPWQGIQLANGYAWLVFPNRSIFLLSTFKQFKTQYCRRGKCDCLIGHFKIAFYTHVQYCYIIYFSLVHAKSK